MTISMRSGPRRPLSPEHVDVSAEWIARHQEPNGAIPWTPGGKFDPWDHIQSAMGLAMTGRFAAAENAFRYMARTQEPDGGWAAWRHAGTITDPTHETNHAAYLASGLWFLHRARPAAGFLAEMWPTLERAINFVVRLQNPNGTIGWAINRDGKQDRNPLLTASSSIHGSLVCAIRIAAELGCQRSSWMRALERLRPTLRGDIDNFDQGDLPASGRYSMDWYYPVLGGAIRGSRARRILSDADKRASFLCEGVGLRCVIERPWYTVAETCELVIALDACGLTSRAHQILSWLPPLRTEVGSYPTGITHPDRIIYPENEYTSWTASTVLLAADTVVGESATATFFRDLAGDEIGSAVTEVRQVTRGELEANPV
jgi:hypothetical protein